MSNDNDNIGLSEKKYKEIYNVDNNNCINSISRSYSSEINVPSVSSNRLRVYSTENKCPGPLRVRSSPSSPNRLSRFQCMTLVRRKWSGINKINRSSSSEFDSYPTSCNSNKSLQCDSNIDQLDLSWQRDSSTYIWTNRPTSCQNLQVNDLSTQNKDDFYLSTGGSSTNLLLKNLSAAIDEEPTDKLQSDSGSDYNHVMHKIENLQGYFYPESRSIMTNKSISNPINFKKVLRDRYLNSQRSSNASTLTSTSSSQNMTQAMSLTDDCLFYPNEFMLPECEDHNFHYIQDRDNKRSLGNDNYQTEPMFDCNHKKSLSIDLKNLSALKKYRIRSTNSTLSSMSGIEAEGDPFSPALTDICSPFLKLNLPYRYPQQQISGGCTPNLLPSSSLGTLTSTHELQNYSPIKPFQSLSTQRFFPETMKLSDFHNVPSFKSDCLLDCNVKERLMVPDVTNGLISYKSAPQSLQLSPNCTQLLSNSMTPVTTCQTAVSVHSLSQISMMNSEEDMYCLRPLISSSSSKSMDYLHTCCLSTDNSNRCDLTSVDDDWLKHHEYLAAKPSNLHSKTKQRLTIGQVSKKTIPMTSVSNQRQCAVCGRHFNRSDMLARHSRVHTGHKPFECSICGQSFSRSDHLNTHMRIHSGEKPYRCSLCSYSACRRDMITRHLRVHRRKGDISLDAISVLVVNTQKPTVSQHKTGSIAKSHNSLHADRGSLSDEDDLITTPRSHSFFDHKIADRAFTELSPLSLTSRITEHSTIIPKTFANISISICQPTPRSSFSMPMESQNYS